MTHSYIKNPTITDIVRQFEKIPSNVLSEALWPSHLNPRKLRSERREACLTVLGVLLRHLDDQSLRTGTHVPGVGFIDLDMKTIAQETGFRQKPENLRRCERAIQILLAQGFIEVKKPQDGETIINHPELRVIWSITPDLITCLEYVLGSPDFPVSPASDFFLFPGQSSFDPSTPLGYSREGWPMTNSNIQNPAIADIVRQFEKIPLNVLSEASWPPRLIPRELRFGHREVYLKALGVLLRHLDGQSRIGIQIPRVGFVALDMKTIAQESDIDLRYCEQVLIFFLTQGLIKVKKTQGGENIIKYSGLRAILSITPALINCLESLAYSLFSKLHSEKSEFNPNGGKP